MEDKDEFLRQMENLKVPAAAPGEHATTVKMAILNAERSAALGIWLIAAPCYFLLCIFMYYFFHLKLNWFQSMFNVIAGLDKNPYLKLSPLILVVLPLISIIINALAIIHVQYLKAAPDARRTKEIIITVKMKTWNIVLILVSLAVVSIFLAYAVAENITINR